jgi:transcriptional regulator of NAD metabolism
MKIENIIIKTIAIFFNMRYNIIAANESYCLKGASNEQADE